MTEPRCFEWISYSIISYPDFVRYAKFDNNGELVTAQCFDPELTPDPKYPRGLSYYINAGNWHEFPASEWESKTGIQTWPKYLYDTTVPHNILTYHAAIRVTRTFEDDGHSNGPYEHYSFDNMRTQPWYTEICAESAEALLAKWTTPQVTYLFDGRQTVVEITANVPENVYRTRIAPEGYPGNQITAAQLKDIGYVEISADKAEKLLDLWSQRLAISVKLQELDAKIEQLVKQ